MYLFFTGFVVDVLELCENLPVFPRFCGGIFGALSKSTCCSQVYGGCFGALSKSICCSQVL